MSQFKQSDFSIAKPNKLNDQHLMKLWATYYHVHTFESRGKIPIVLNSDSLSGLFADTCDFCKAALEGTAFVTTTDGKTVVINYASTNDSNYVDCRTCKHYSNSKLNVERWGRTKWIITDGYGNGVQQFKLIPYRTIAVDPKKIPYGSVIYIPSMNGLIFEQRDGSKLIHDGYFFAGDTGSAIHDDHIDIFTGISEKNPFPTVISSNVNEKFEAFQITDSLIIESLKKLHIKTQNIK
jgi:3D (Asp-Asp-Asp) domain-containing protein